MNFKLLSTLIISATLVGCSSVPMQSQEDTEKAKLVSPPSEGKTGVYIYRPSLLGAALKSKRPAITRVLTLSSC